MFGVGEPAERDGRCDYSACDTRERSGGRQNGKLLRSRRNITCRGHLPHPSPQTENREALGWFLHSWV